MTTYTDLYPPAAVLLGRVFWLESGVFTYTVPVGATYVRAEALASGGYSTESRGGGSAYAQATEPVTPGEILDLQVGVVSTGGVLGNSFVKHQSGDTIVLADRGRGTGLAGEASNSIGTTRRSGMPGPVTGGDSGSDASDFAPLGFFGVGASTTGVITAGPGGGGWLLQTYDPDTGYVTAYYGYAAGPGKICLEFYNVDPGF